MYRIRAISPLPYLLRATVHVNDGVNGHVRRDGGDAKRNEVNVVEQEVQPTGGREVHAHARSHLERQEGTVGWRYCRQGNAYFAVLLILISLLSDVCTLRGMMDDKNGLCFMVRLKDRVSQQD